MGLDMYLNRAKRINSATASEIDNAENYLSWLNRPDEYINSTPYEWCGLRDADIDLGVAADYENEYRTRYAAWDDERKYGHDGLWDGVAYWRKANAIHSWFVRNVQDGEDDCGTYEVAKEQLDELLSLCKDVKNHSLLVNGKIYNGRVYSNGSWEDIYEDGQIVENPTYAMNHLPTEEGFFFGSTSYDQWYVADLNYTIEALTKVLKETDFDNEVIAYSASW